MQAPQVLGPKLSKMIRNRAVEFAERAKKPLYAFPPSSERDALLALPDYVLSRDR